jgi:hypothetical protein
MLHLDWLSDGAHLVNGFLQAILLRAEAWEPLFASSRDGKLLLPILSLWELRRKPCSIIWHAVC